MDNDFIRVAPVMLFGNASFVSNNVYGTDGDDTPCKFAARLPLFINTDDLEGLECLDYDAAQCGAVNDTLTGTPTPMPTEPPTAEPTVSSSPEKGAAVLSFIAVVVVGFMIHV
jgi:hypothetical protein